MVQVLVRRQREARLLRVCLLLVGLLLVVHISLMLRLAWRGPGEEVVVAALRGAAAQGQARHMTRVHTAPVRYAVPVLLVLRFQLQKQPFAE